jgi:replicative DNA helicase
LRKQFEEERGDRAEPVIEIPHDIVNEQILIAAVLVDSDARTELTAKLNPELFVEPAHFAVWAAMRKMRQQGVEFSVATLHQACAGQIELEYLERLQQSYPEPPASLGHHSALLRWDAIRAGAVRGPVADLLKALRDSLAPREKIRSIARQISGAFDQITDRQFMLDPMVLARSHFEEMRCRTVWPYGIEGLDKYESGDHRLIPGAAPGKITLITGVSGAAKSVIAAMITLAQARMRKRVLYGAWEMGSGPTLELLALMSLGLSRYVVSTGKLDAEQLLDFKIRMEQIGTYVRFFDAPFVDQFSKRYTNDESIDEIHQKVADSGAEIVVLDLCERAIPDGNPDSERRALFRIQQIFKETRSHGLLVCQQKLKEIENRSDKRPTRSTILGSQAWVDIADTILGLHRPGQWKPIGDDTLQIFVLKQRFGRWPLAIEGDWNGDACSLSNCHSIEYEAIGSAGGFAEEFLGGGKGSKFRR